MTSAVIEKKQVNGGAVLSVTTGLTKANELNLKGLANPLMAPVKWARPYEPLKKPC